MYLALSKMKNYSIILASQSPRRQQLLQDLGINFSLRSIPVDEDYPETLAPEQVALFLAEKKGKIYQPGLSADELVITADTTVVIEERVLNKPADAQQATDMLIQLSGKVHQVITGVCLTTADGMHSFSDTTRVFFRTLRPTEIEYYVTQYKPYDKAGGYAIQEWIGMIGIEKIEGSYFNVVGLPVEKLYRALNEWR